MAEPTAMKASERQLVLAAVLLSLGGAVGLGFGRFAYALLLEPMRSGLGWSYAEAGLINSANAVGYLLGTICVGPAVARLGAPATVRAGVLLASLALLATGLASAFPLLLLLRVLNGFGGGLIFVGGAAVVMQRSPAGAPPPLGLYYSGPGIGIAVSGLLVPALLGQLDGEGWRTVWLLLGGAGLLVLALIEPQLRAAGGARRPAARAAGGPGRPGGYRQIWTAMLSFLIYGVGYIGYMTFVVAYLQARPGGAGLVPWFWAGLGICAAAGSLVWSPVVARLGPRPTMAAQNLTLALAALLPLAWPAGPALGISAALFGGTFLAVVAAMTSEVRLRLPPERWASGTGHAVALFATGQLIGPALTGLVADLPGGLGLGLGLSAGALGLAALVALIGAGRR